MNTFLGRLFYFRFRVCERACKRVCKTVCVAACIGGLSGCVINEVEVPVIERYAEQGNDDTVSDRPYGREAGLIVEERTFPDPDTASQAGAREPVVGVGDVIPVFSQLVVSHVVLPSTSEKPVADDKNSGTPVYSPVYQGAEVVNKLANVEFKKKLSTVTVKKTSYLVQKGDTLFSIAWRFDHDPAALAALNNIEAPYVIYPEQRLNLLRSMNKTLPHEKTDQKIASENKVLDLGYKKGEVDKKTIQKKSGKNFSNTVNLYWVWPADGKIINRFQVPKVGASNEASRSARVSNGIDIEGRSGQPVYAAADGQVVYSGQGLRGYGKLIIVKHDHEWLSAYGHNKKLLVNEGDSIKAGEQIAEIGSTGIDKERLHFEIRRGGKPVDPLLYLPSRSSLEGK